MRTAVAVAQAVALSIAATAPAAAQQTDELGDLMDTLAVLWTTGDAAALAGLGASAGLELEVHGQLMGSVQGRRAVAALRQLLGGQETVSVRAGAASKVGGVDDRAFAEFIWMVRTPGTEATEARTIFIALIREQRVWRISEIRILR